MDRNNRTAERMEILKLVNELKIYRGNDDDFNKNIDKLRSFIEKNNVPLHVLGEILGGFIVERCDNMLANTPLSDRARKIIHELSRKAYELYVYSVLKHLLFNNELFIKYVLDLDGKITFEAHSREELRRLIDRKIIGSAKKVLDDNGYKLLSSTIIADEKQLEEILPILKEALRKKIITLKITPSHNTATLPLFFKEYYIPADDRRKLRLIAIALDRIIKAFEQYFKQDETAYEYITSLGKHVSQILGAESIDKFASQNKENNKDIDLRSINYYIVEGKRIGNFFYLKFLYKDRIICLCDDWPGFQKCIRSLKLPDEITVQNRPDLWQCISNMIYEILYKTRQIREYLTTLIEKCKLCINENKQEIIPKDQDESFIPAKIKAELTDKLHKTINDVLNKNMIRILEINGKKIIVKPSLIDIPANIFKNTLIIDVHRKKKGIIEILINNTIYSVHKDYLKQFIRETLIRTIQNKI